MREAHSPRTLSDETRRNCLTKRNCRSLIPRSSPSPPPPASPLYHAQRPPSLVLLSPISFISVKSMSFDFFSRSKIQENLLSTYHQILSMIFPPKRIVVRRIASFSFFLSFVAHVWLHFRFNFSWKCSQSEVVQYSLVIGFVKNWG